MKSLKDADNVFIIGQTREGLINIYKIPRDQAIDGMKFETWLSARRYIRSNLEAKRMKVMEDLFEVDRSLRRVEKLKEAWCRPLNSEEVE